MKLIYLSLFTCLSLISASVTDPIDKVGELLGRGNVHELAKLFAADMELTLLDGASTYSSNQAEVILEKFFAENRPVSCKMLHKVNSGSTYRFGVILINTNKGVYRAAFTLKDTGGNIQLIGLRMENEKVK